jgi:hypothetical protein
MSLSSVFTIYTWLIVLWTVLSAGGVPVGLATPLMSVTIGLGVIILKLKSPIWRERLASRFDGSVTREGFEGLWSIKNLYPSRWRQLVASEIKRTDPASDLLVALIIAAMMLVPLLLVTGLLILLCLGSEVSLAIFTTPVDYFWSNIAILVLLFGACCVALILESSIHRPALVSRLDSDGQGFKSLWSLTNLFPRRWRHWLASETESADPLARAVVPVAISAMMLVPLLLVAGLLYASYRLFVQLWPFYV